MKTITYNNSTFKVNETPDITKKLAFINSVVDTLIQDNECFFLEDLRDIVFDFYLIDIFTDIDTKSSSQSIESIEAFVNEMSLAIGDIKNILGQNLIFKFNKAIDKSIEEKTGVKFNDWTDTLRNILDSLETKISNVSNVDMNDFSELAKKLNSLKDNFDTKDLVEALTETKVFKNRLEQTTNQKKYNRNNRNHKNYNNKNNYRK